MKIKFISKLSFMISCFLVLSNCSTNDDTSTNNSAEINQIKNTVMSSTWQITNFIDSGVDETNHFMGYSFTFNGDGSLIASNGSTTINGTWSVTDSSNSNDDDSSTDDIDFNMFFSSPANFNDDLTEDWNIVSRTNSKIELIHISGGNGGTDSLTFERIS